MDSEEAGFLTWVLVGNCLNAVLRSWPPQTLQLSAREHAELAEMDARLQDVKPHAMTSALQTLPEPARHLLLNTCRRALDHAGAEAETVLGVQREEAAHLLARLSAQT